MIGGKIQKPPCDEISTNPLLVFNTNNPTTLLTVPLNLMTLRYIRMYGKYLSGEIISGISFFSTVHC